MSKFSRIEEAYYDYDRYQKSIHDEDNPDECDCISCEETRADDSRS